MCTVALGSGPPAICALEQIFSGHISPLPSQLTQVTIGDFNGDGVSDIVGLCDGDVVAAIAAPPHGFTVLPPVDPGFDAFRLAVSDFNADGRGDVVVTSGSASGLIAVLLSDASGGLAAGNPIVSGGLAAGLAAADVDGDGRIDVVMSDFTQNSLRVFLGDGAGGLVEGPVVEGISAGLLAVGDVTGDGVVDAAVAGNHTLRVLPGTGAGFSPDYAAYPSGGQAIDLFVCDVSGDALPDVVLRSKELRVFLGNASGDLQASSVTVLPGAGSNASALADFDCDGDLDCGGRLSTCCLDILCNDGFGHFVPSTQIEIAFPIGPVLGADFDGDGTTDIACASDVTGSPGSPEPWIALIRGQGDGSFVVPEPIGDEIGYGYGNLVLADFDGDQDLDEAHVGDWVLVEISLNDGSGTFLPAPTLYMSALPNSLACADFNGDGLPDLAVAQEDSSSFFVTGVSIRLGLGDGTFGPVKWVTVGGSAQEAEAADLDFDGDEDLVCALSQPLGLSVALNNGDSTFLPPVVFTIGRHVGEIELANLDEDPALELVFGDHMWPWLWISDGLGDGQFGTPAAVILPGVGSVRGVDSADLDLDGDLDLAVVLAQLLNGDEFTVLIMINDGSGGLSVLHSIVVAADYAESIALTDLTGDGLPDIALALADAPGMGVMPGRGDASFDPMLWFLGGVTFNLAFGDVDDDGDLDAVCGGDVRLYRNHSSEWRRGDLTCDGFVDASDLAALLSSWAMGMGCLHCGDPDLNHDGVIDGADLGALLENWG